MFGDTVLFLLQPLQRAQSHLYAGGLDGLEEQSDDRLFNLPPS
jgi:hypothetical protein